MSLVTNVIQASIRNVNHAMFLRGVPENQRQYLDEIYEHAEATAYATLLNLHGVRGTDVSQYLRCEEEQLHVCEDTAQGPCTEIRYCVEKGMVEPVTNVLTLQDAFYEPLDITRAQATCTVHAEPKLEHTEYHPEKHGGFNVTVTSNKENLATKMLDYAVGVRR